MGDKFDRATFEMLTNNSINAINTSMKTINQTVGSINGSVSTLTIRVNALEQNAPNTVIEELKTTRDTMKIIMETLHKLVERYDELDRKNKILEEHILSFENKDE